MRRTHSGPYYEPIPTNYNEGDVLEGENEMLTDELKDKISVLKSLSIDIGDEVKYQDKLLGDMDEDMERTGSFLGSTSSRVIKMVKGGQNYYILYLLLFSIFIFFIVYLVLKFS